MPINSSLISFNDLMIQLSPNEKGVYALWDNGELIYYGKSDISIRNRLMSHKRGDEGYCTKNATHFQTEVTIFASTREHQLILEFQQQFGRLPRCNDVI